VVNVTPKKNFHPPKVILKGDWGRTGEAQSDDLLMFKRKFRARVWAKSSQGKAKEKNAGIRASNKRWWARNVAVGTSVDALSEPNQEKEEGAADARNPCKGKKKNSRCRQVGEQETTIDGSLDRADALKLSTTTTRKEKTTSERKNRVRGKGKRGKEAKGGVVSKGLRGTSSGQEMRGHMGTY